MMNGNFEMKILIFCFIICYADALCTFPDELNGTWYSSHKGEINFNSSYMTGYSIFMSALVNSLDFICEEKAGNLYMLKSTETVYAFFSFIDAYICLELNRVSEYKYYYYIGTSVSNTNNDYIYGRSTGSAVTMDMACNRPTPYETGTFVVLMKDGAIHDGYTDATCPSELLAFYTSVTITDYSGASECTGNVMDGCSTSSTMQYSYASCSSGLAFSTAGKFFCLHQMSSDGVKYVSVWNNDTTVDGSTTYRCTCLALAESSTNSSVVYATEYPNFCSDTSQNSITVASPGIKFIMTSSNTTCNVSVDGGGYGGLIALIILLSLGALGAGALVTIIYIRFKKDKKRNIQRPSIFSSCFEDDGDTDQKDGTKAKSKNTVAPEIIKEEGNDDKDGPESPKTSARLPPLTPKGDNSKKNDNSIQSKLPPIKENEPTKKK